VKVSSGTHHLAASLADSCSCARLPYAATRWPGDNRCSEREGRVMSLGRA
jgi:hypothetical protein